MANAKVFRPVASVPVYTVHKKHKKVWVYCLVCHMSLTVDTGMHIDILICPHGAHAGLLGDILICQPM